MSSSTPSEPTNMMDEVKPDIIGPSDQSDMPSTPNKNTTTTTSTTSTTSSLKKDSTPRKPRRSPSSSPTETKSSSSTKQHIIGCQPSTNAPYKPSDVDVVVALFERVVSKGTPEDVGAIAEQFGVDKRLLRLSWNNTFKKKGIKLIREGWS